jgi:hypothetical protein
VYFAIQVLNIISAAVILLLSFAFIVQLSSPYKTFGKADVLNFCSGVYIVFQWLENCVGQACYF